MSNTGDIEMALINPTTSNQSQNQDASKNGVEDGKGHEISKGNWVSLILLEMNEKRWLNQKTVLS